MYIKDRKIGSEENPSIIAEIGINHGGNLDIAKQMVDSAKRAGVEVIKHQTHIVEDEMSPKAKKVIPGNSNKFIYEIMDECSLNYDEEYELMRYVEKRYYFYFNSIFASRCR